MKCHFCSYPLIFTVRMIDFFPTDEQTDKLPTCDKCWKEICPKYTCVFSNPKKPCYWPAPRVEAGNRDPVCHLCGTYEDCHHGWCSWVSVCVNHSPELDEYIEEETKRRMVK
jgi:hypothetical protein